MNIFSFTAHFGSEEDCRLHFQGQRDKEGLSASDAGHFRFCGYRVNGVMNAKVAVSAPRCAAVHDHGELKLPFLVVQNDVPDELHKKGFSITNSRSN